MLLPGAPATRHNNQTYGSVSPVTLLLNSVVTFSGQGALWNGSAVRRQKRYLGER